MRKPPPYISPEDLTLLNQRAIDGILKHGALTEDMDADEIDEHNNRLCKRRLQNYCHDNIRMFA
jgi:hypothetical protein